MNERNIKITTKDGTMDTFITEPDEDNKLPTIIFYMDAPAIREELRDMARRLATSGYSVLLPNLFYRVGTESNYPFDQDLIRTEKEHLKIMLNTMNETSNKMVIDDTASILEYLNTQEKNSKIGALGYCMSGQYVVSVAASFPNNFAAIASFYGVGIYTNKSDSPHLLAKNIKSKVYLSFAEIDKYVSAEEIAKMRKYFENLDLDFRIEVYEGTEHGFAFPDRYCYDKIAAERHWCRINKLFEILKS